MQPDFILADQTQSAGTYNGPYFEPSPRMYYSIPWGTYLAQLKSTCMEYYTNQSNRHFKWPHHALVLNCIYANMSFQQQANVALHSYYATLWPAILSGEARSSVIYKIAYPLEDPTYRFLFQFKNYKLFRLFLNRSL